MSPRFVLGWENVPCVAEVVNRLLKADCIDFITSFPTSPRGDSTQLMIEIEPKLKYRELPSITQ